MCDKCCGMGANETMAAPENRELLRALRSAKGDPIKSGGPGIPKALAYLEEAIAATREVAEALEEKLRRVCVTEPEEGCASEAKAMPEGNSDMENTLVGMGDRVFSIRRRLQDLLRRVDL